MPRGRTRSSVIPGVISAALALAVLHQSAISLLPRLHGRIYSAVAGAPAPQMVERSGKGDRIAPLMITTRGHAPAVKQTELPASPPPPIARQRLPVGCEAAYSPLASRTSV